jgi:hypothetical protein
MMHFFPRHSWQFVFPAVALSACRPPDRVEVTQSRPAFRNEPKPEASSDRDRFAENEIQRMLTWQTPEGWRLVAATDFRHINYIFGPSGEGECFLSLISGEGAGVFENFNRWRKQMGQPPITEAELASLPTKSVLGRPVPTIEITGTYDPGSGPMAPAAGPPKPNWRLVGSIFEAPGALFTIKMTGPKDLVEQNLAAYDAFLKSIAPGALLRRPE